LRAGDQAALQEGLRRNVYQDAPDGDAERLSGYVEAAHAALAARSPVALAQEGLIWPDPAAVKPKPTETSNCD
jgi:hypothetical protein